MTTIYPDHSALVREEDWPAIRAALSGSAQLVLSDWNLVEIAQASDRDQAMRRADFLWGLNPHWVVPRLFVQAAEVRAFLERTYWGTEVTPVRAITPSFATMLSYALGPRVPIGWRARDYVANLHDNPNYLREIQAAKLPCVAALKTQQAAGAQARAKIEPAVLRQWLDLQIPEAAPDGRYLTAVEKEAAVVHCLSRSDELFATSPALAVESALTEVRARDARREPELQDAIDYQHIVVGLAYCDTFVARDRHALHCARETVKMLAPMKIADVVSFSDAFPGKAAA